MACHEGQPLLREGPELARAGAAMILLHGRDSSADEILRLSPQFGRTDIAFLAPQAENRSWYPYSFLVPVAQNEPGLASTMRLLSSLVLEAELEGIPPGHVFLLGLGQGACLALEFAVRHPGRYGGVFALSGGLFGPPGTTWQPDGTLDGTPVVICSGDVDPQTPRVRVEETADVLCRMGAEVALRILSGAGLTVSGEEIEAIGAVLARSHPG